jgi:hypothetical protein
VGEKGIKERLGNIAAITKDFALHLHHERRDGDAINDIGEREAASTSPTSLITSGA